MRRFTFSADAFGDRFALADLPLPDLRAAMRCRCSTPTPCSIAFPAASCRFGRPGLDGLFASFDDAYAAACRWVEANRESPQDHCLAIVPAGFDDVLQRHVLIYGVLCG